MSDEITVRLSRADAEIISSALTVAEFECAIDEQDSRRLVALLDVALAGDPAPEAAQFDQRMRAAMRAAGERTLREQFAAPAEGPDGVRRCATASEGLERAATGVSRESPSATAPPHRSGSPARG